MEINPPDVLCDGVNLGLTRAEGKLLLARLQQGQRQFIVNQIVEGVMVRASAVDRRDHVAIATPVTAALVINACDETLRRRLNMGGGRIRWQSRGQLAKVADEGMAARGKRISLPREINYFFIQAIAAAQPIRVPRRYGAQPRFAWSDGSEVS